MLPSPATALTDGVVTLRRFTRDDVADLVEIVGDPLVRARNAVPIATVDAVSAWLSRVEYQRRSGRRLVLAVCDAATGTLAGARTLTISSRSRTAELSCWLAPEWRGRSFGPRSARLVAEWAFASLGLDHVALYCETDNLAAQRGAEKAGFTLLGPLDNWHAGAEMLAYRLSAAGHEAAAAA